MKLKELVEIENLPDEMFEDMLKDIE